MFGLGHLPLKQSSNKKLMVSELLITISQFNFGFNQQGFAATQAMDAFARQLGKWNPKKGVDFLDSIWLPFFNGFNYLGQAAGLLIGSFVSKRYGLRMCMFTMIIMSIWASMIHRYHHRQNIENS